MDRQILLENRFTLAGRDLLILLLLTAQFLCSCEPSKSGNSDDSNSVELLDTSSVALLPTEGRKIAPDSSSKYVYIDSCIVDTALSNGFILGEAEACVAAFGDLTEYINDYSNAAPDVLIEFKGQNQFLTLYKWYGTGRNQFHSLLWEKNSRERFSQTRKIILTSSDSLKTQIGVSLGMRYKKFLELFPNHNCLRISNESNSYFIVSNNHGKDDLYFSKYFFDKSDSTISKLEFGYNYP